MNSQIRKHFDLSTTTYRSSAIVQKKVADRCCSHIPEKQFFRVLEMGAGGGLLTDACIRVLKRSSIYVALDLSAMMLKLISWQNASLIQADGEVPPFRDNSFSLLISSSAMQWYRHGTESLLNNLRLLEKGGFFSLAIFVKGTFRQMKHATAVSGFGSLYPLLSAREYVQGLNSAGLNPSWSVHEYTEYHASVQEFLKSHKQTGATYTSPKAGAGKKAYRAFCREYKDAYSTESGIPASYRVLYLWGSRH